MESWNVDIYDAFARGWALVTAGNEAHFNTMTVSWGGLGSLWNKQVATVYVRPSRYTYDFMEAFDTFTVSFYPEEYKSALGLLGRLSGRDCDKVSQSGLTPVKAGDSMSFAEAKMTLVCRKLYAQDLDPAQIPADVMARFYPEGETVHRMYIGQVVEMIRND